MQDPIDDSGTQFPHTNEAGSEEPAGIHQENSADGKNSAMDSGQTTATPKAFNRSFSFIAFCGTTW